MSLKTRSGRLKSLGNIELLDKIAEGGMGSVYRGRDAGTGDLVAVKLLAPELADRPVLLKRFEQEFRTASSLRHPNVVRGLAFGVEGGHHFLVMEYVDGPSLGRHIAEKGRLPEARALVIVTQIAEALHQAHAQNLVHRDVKPDNILLTSDGRAKLADLGLVKRQDVDVELTMPNSGLGTPNFMAPEQFSDAKNADRRCDIYSLAATLYMALTGELPFNARTPLNILKKKLRNELRPVREIVPSVSERAARAVTRALSIDPGRRQVSCLEFVADLNGTNQRPTVLPDPPPRAPVPPRRGPERRATVRFPSRQEGACLPVAGEATHTWSARIQDISAGGISLLLRRRFEPRTTLLLQLKGREHGRRHTLMVKVIRAQPHTPKGYLVGCSFARKLSDEELSLLR